ncbi:MAG: deoxyribodipyrimidine photo-lyase, partial [Frankiaceae bacterium]|nr:deoxyribodipyrimidine photo-lyase [Frankiaceae bacterium]
MLLPAVPHDRDAIVAWVDEHLGYLSADAVAASDIRGGQQAADTALATLDLTGYASQRSAVLPVERRGATRLSPYIRHGLLPLPQVWAAAKDAPPRDRKRFRDELLWQEYARHVYARIGRAHREPLRFASPTAAPSSAPQHGDEPWHDWPWPEAMACMAATSRELTEDGWLVNQTRMWMASQWAVRAG